MGILTPSSSPTIPMGAGTPPMPATGGYNASSLLPTQYPPNTPSPPPTLSPPPQQPMSNFSGIPTGGYNGGQSFSSLQPNMPSPAPTMSPPPQTNMSNFSGIPTGGYSQAPQQTPQFSQQEIDMIMQARQQGYSPSSSSSSYVTPEQARYEAEQAQVKFAQDSMIQNMNAQISTTTSQTSALKSMTDAIKGMIPKRESPTSTTDTDSSTK